MVNDSDKENYRSTKAPDELKKRVMDMYSEAQAPKKNTFNYKKYLSLAACLILIVGISAFFSVSRVSVSLDDSNVAALDTASSYKQYSSMIGERSSFKSKVVFTMDLNSNIPSTVSVTGGKVTLFNEETGEKLSEGEKLTFKGKVVAFWDITFLNGNDAEMTVKNSFFSKSLRAEYNAENKTYIVK